MHNTSEAWEHWRWSPWTGCIVGPPSHRRQTFRLHGNNRGSFPADLLHDAVWISRGTKEVAVTMRYMATRFSKRRILNFVYATWTLAFRQTALFLALTWLEMYSCITYPVFLFAPASWRRVKIIVQQTAEGNVCADRIIIEWNRRDKLSRFDIHHGGNYRDRRQEGKLSIQQASEQPQSVRSMWNGRTYVELADRIPRFTLRAWVFQTFNYARRTAFQAPIDKT